MLQPPQPGDKEPRTQIVVLQPVLARPDALDLQSPLQALADWRDPANPDAPMILGRVPASHVRVGHAPPLRIKQPSGYCGFGFVRAETLLRAQRQRWPADKLARFEAAAASRKRIRIDGVTTGQDNQPLLESTESLREPHDTLAVGDLRALHALPGLSRLELQGLKPFLLEYLRENLALNALTLMAHGQATLNFSGTHLLELRLDATDLKTLHLNQGLSRLVLLGTVQPPLRIHAFEQGRWLSLSVAPWAQQPLAGLGQLRELTLSGALEVDLAAIATQCPQLQSLDVHGHLGLLRHFSHLQHLPQLRHFSCTDMYGYGPQDLPDFTALAHLESLSLNGLPQDAGQALKKQLKARPDLQVSLRGLRSADWVAANQGNPFRSWDQRPRIGRAIAQKAAKQYKTTYQHMLALAQQPAHPRQQAVQALAEDFVQAFNSLQAKNGFIESLERDEIAAAFWHLVQTLEHKTRQPAGPRRHRARVRRPSALADCAAGALRNGRGALRWAAA